MKAKTIITVPLAIVGVVAGSYGLSWATSDDGGTPVHVGPPDSGWFEPDRAGGRATVAQGTSGGQQYRVDVSGQGNGELCIEVSQGEKDLVGGCGPAPRANRPLGPVIVDGRPGVGDRLVVGLVDRGVRSVRLSSGEGGLTATAKEHPDVEQRVFVAKVAGERAATSLEAQLLDGTGRAVAEPQTLWQK